MAVKSPYLTAEEAAAYLRTTTGTLSQWRLHNRGPAFHRLGAKILYRLEDLESFVTPGAA